MNMFKLVSSDDHQMSLAWGPCPMRSYVWGTCTVRSNASWVMVTWDSPLPMHRQTHTSENITFPQVRWRAVIKVVDCQTPLFMKLCKSDYQSLPMYVVSVWIDCNLLSEIRSLLLHKSDFIVRTEIEVKISQTSCRQFEQLSNSFSNKQRTNSKLQEQNS